MHIVDLFIKYFPTFMNAMVETLKLTAISLLFATIIGILVGLVRVSKVKVLYQISGLYIGSSGVRRCWFRHTLFTLVFPWQPVFA